MTLDITRLDSYHLVGRLTDPADDTLVAWFEITRSGDAGYTVDLQGRLPTFPDLQADSLYRTTHLSFDHTFVAALEARLAEGGRSLDTTRPSLRREPDTDRFTLADGPRKQVRLSRNQLAELLGACHLARVRLILLA